jgi:hypothetical protein
MPVESATAITSDVLIAFLHRSRFRAAVLTE